MSRVLIVGATRGLGASLVKKYASNSRNTVHATTRSDWAPKDFPELENVKWACRVDLMKPEVGKILTSQLGSEALDVVVRSHLLIRSLVVGLLTSSDHLSRTFHDGRLHFWP